MTADSFDLIVLGLGPGGEDLAEAMAGAGWNVLGVEARLTGGECPYFGCIPSKMMLRGAEVIAEGRRVNELSGDALVTPDFRPVHARISAEATDDWNDQVAVDRFTDTGGHFVRGAGRITGHDGTGFTVDVGGTGYRGKRVVVATGTAPQLPPVEGLAELHKPDRLAASPVWTNREAVRAETAPASLIVLGGGPIGCEMAQAFSRYGTAVTLIENAPRITAIEEPETSEAITAVFGREGIDVRAGVKAVRAQSDPDGVRLTLEDGTSIAAEKLLVAAGRHPNLDEIGLDTVGLDPSARSLTVDEHMAVAGAPDGLFAIGDIAGHGAFTHLAVWQSRVLTAHLKGEDENFGGYDALAWATFTDPEIGRVGMTEKQARDAGLTVRVGTQQIASNSRGWIHGPGNDGFVKLIEDADRGVLVGGTVVAPNGGEIIGLVTLAVHAAVPVRTLRSMHYVFPTMHRAVLEAVNALA